MQREREGISGFLFDLRLSGYKLVERVCTVVVGGAGGGAGGDAVLVHEAQEGNVRKNREAAPGEIPLAMGGFTLRNLCLPVVCCHCFSCEEQTCVQL